MVPADDKPFARVAAAAIIANALIEIDPRFPKVPKEVQAELQTQKAALEAEAPKGAAPDPNEATLAEKAARKTDKGKHGNGKSKKGGAA